MPNAKILVTGGAGFIGSNLVDQLLKEPSAGSRRSVYVIDDLSSGKKENINPKAEFIRQDLTEKSAGVVINKIKPDLVYHLAAQKSVSESVKDPYRDLNTNLVGLLNLMQALKQLRIRPKTIFSSTGGAIYGDTAQIPTPEEIQTMPASPYGITKLASEKYLHYYNLQFGLKKAILRFANVYGPRQDPQGEAGVIAIFCERALKNQPLTVYGDGKQTRDYVYVGDVVTALILAATNKVNQPINIGTGKETSVLDLINKIQDSLGQKLQTEHASARPGEQKRSALAIKRAEEKIGFTPQVQLKEGITKTIQWFKSRI